MPQSAKKVFLGKKVIAKARMTIIAKIITAPAKLICNRLICTTSLQVTDNLFQRYLMDIKLFDSELKVMAVLWRDGDVPAKSFWARR